MSTNEDLPLFDDEAPAQNGSKARLISEDAEQAVKEAARKVGATSEKMARAAVAQASATAARIRESKSATGTWKWIAGGGAAVLAIVALVMLLRRPDSQEAPVASTNHPGPTAIAGALDNPPLLPTAEACTKSLGASNAFESRRASGSAQDPVFNSRWATFIFACTKRGHYGRATQGGPLVLGSTLPSPTAVASDPNDPRLPLPAEWEGPGLTPMQAQARGEAGCRSAFATEVKVFAKLKGPDGDLLYPSEKPWRAQIQRCLSAGYLQQSRDGSQLLLPDKPRPTSEAVKPPAAVGSMPANVESAESVPHAQAVPVASNPSPVEGSVYPPLPGKAVAGTCQLDLVTKTLRAVGAKSEKVALTDEEKNWIAFGYECLARGYLQNGFEVPKAKVSIEPAEKSRVASTSRRAVTSLAKPVALASPVSAVGFGTPSCTISGTVLSQNGGRPLAGATVQISGAGAPGGRAVATTDAAGAFKIEGAIRLPNAVPLILSISAPKHIAQQLTPMWSCSVALPTTTLETCNAFSCVLRKAIQQPVR